MAESGGGAPQNSTRVLAVTAAVAAVIAFAVAIGLMFRSGDGADGGPAPTSAPVATTTARTTVVVQPTVRPTGTVSPNFSAPNTSPLPTQPAHRVGEDCVTGGISGRWDVVTGTGWVCIPAVPSTTPSTGTAEGGG